jgi:hypothetical protein
MKEMRTVLRRNNVSIGGVIAQTYGAAEKETLSQIRMNVVHTSWLLF